MIGVINSPSKKGILDEAKSYSDTKANELNDTINALPKTAIKHRQKGTFTNGSINITLSGFENKDKMVGIVNGLTYTGAKFYYGPNGYTHGYSGISIPYVSSLDSNKLQIGYATASGIETADTNNTGSRYSTDAFNTISEHMTYTVVEFY